MATNLYRVIYNSTVKVGSAGPNQIRCGTDEQSVFVSATSEANAVAAAKSNDKRGSTANTDFSYTVKIEHPNIITGS